MLATLAKRKNPNESRSRDFIAPPQLKGDGLASAPVNRGKSSLVWFRVSLTENVSVGGKRTKRERV